MNLISTNLIKNKVLIVGGGTMGADVATVFARGGFPVIVLESNPSTISKLPEHFLSRLSEMDLLDRKHLITVASSFDDITWNDIDLVVECIPEKLEIKKNLFAKLETLVNPNAVLTSNSSSYPISKISEGLASASRMLGLHFFMPAYVVPCVEIVCGTYSSHEIANELIALMTLCQMVPVLVKKDLPGFVGNRLQHAISREALNLVDNGIVSLEDVDKVVRFSFGFRYLAAGPVLQRDHAGLEIHAAAAASIYPSLNNSTEIPKCLTDRVNAGKLGIKTGEGFFQWSPESIENERRRYNDILQASIEIIKKDIPK